MKKATIAAILKRIRKKATWEIAAVPNVRKK
jgi:hypothetical protein